jgi:exopolysaccharide production protein ExoQ
VTILVLYMRWALKQSVRRAVVAMACLFVVGVAAIRYVISHLVQVTGLLDRSPTLTGRVQLWILSCVAALRRPWLGYGYEAFWLPDTAFVQRIWHVMNWNAPSAHNGFIELWLELGIIGTLLFLLGFAYYLVCALRLVHSHSEPAVWCLAYLMFLFCIDLTEPIFFGANSIFFILYVTVAISLHKESEESRAATPFAVTQGDYAYRELQQKAGSVDTR